MVYESDFYTTRRPYTRPTVTSYSVTRREVPWNLVPTVPRPSQVPPCYTAFGSKGLPEDDDDDDYFGYPYSLYRAQPYHRNIPYIGHKRLVIVQPSAHGWRVKQSSLLGEIDRIYHKVRPCLAYQPKEDYLNSRSIMSFDDETRSIRAKTNELLKKIHTPVPRAQRPLPLPGETIDEFLKLRHELSNVAMKLITYPKSADQDRLYYSHTELPITERIMSDNYIDRMLTSSRPVTVTLTQYEDPKSYRLGRTNLACVSYAGGKPILRRRNLASVENYIRDDINVLSHYNRFRQAAEKAQHTPDTEYGSIPHLPPTKSPVTGSWKSNAPRRTQSDKNYARLSETIASDDAESAERKKKRREAVEEAAMKEAAMKEAAMKEAEDEKRRAQELKRQEELAEQAAAERQKELEKKAQQEEEERILREEAERQEALRKAQEEEERKAREEEEARLAAEEEERKAKEEEAKRKAQEEAERKAEEERKAKEEEERRIREEEEQKAREEEERRLKEEEERLAREEEERKAEEERLAREEEEKRKAAEAEEEEEAAEEEEKPEEPEPESTPAEEPEVEEPENEPVVEEPQSPEEAPAKSAGAEEVDEEEEEEEEEDE